MVNKGTPRKFVLRAVLQGSRRPLIETFTTRPAAEERRLVLERAGYTVLVWLAEDESALRGGAGDQKT
jgi:hypothetical protein